jgi:hypothetical protein
MTTSTYTFDGDIVGDLHKDAFGFRPSQNWWADWQSMNDEGKQQEWDSLLVALERAIAEEKSREQGAVIRFEMLVDATIATGAKTRADAIRWMMDAADVGGDVGFFEWKQGIPYGYVSKTFG